MIMFMRLRLGKLLCRWVVSFFSGIVLPVTTQVERLERKFILVHSPYFSDK